MPSEISNRTGFWVFALQDGRAFLDLTRCHDVDDFHLHQITAAQFAVDRHVEQCKVAMVLGQFKSNSDRLDVFGLERTFLADDAPFVPGWPKRTNGG